MIASNTNPAPDNEPKEPRPYAKRSKKQRLEAVEIALGLLNNRQPVSVIKAALAKRYGVGHRQAMSDIARARAKMLANLGRPREEHQADAYAFYDSVVKDKTQKTGDRIDAQERIDKLLGLEAPQKLAGPDGGPLTMMALLTASASVPAPQSPTTSPPNQFDPDRFIESAGGDT